MPAKAPFSPSVTSRRSLSLPTQAMTKSWPWAASLGVAARLPPNLATQESAMAPAKQQILDSLAKVPAPDGTPLTETDALSDVVVTDGKVFFSIAVDAAQ